MALASLRAMNVLVQRVCHSPRILNSVVVSNHFIFTREQRNRAKLIKTTETWETIIHKPSHEQNNFIENQMQFFGSNSAFDR